jgi:hypothetical protein
VITVPAVDRPASRIRHQPAAHALCLDARVKAQSRSEGCLGRAIGNELERAKQATAANVADVRVFGEPSCQRLREVFAARAHLGEQPLVADRVLHGERRGARERMTDVRVSMLEGAGAAFQCVADTFRNQSRADHAVSAAETLGDRHEIGHDAFLLAGVQRAGAAHAAHHFVQDQQDAVAIA